MAHHMACYSFCGSFMIALTNLVNHQGVDPSLQIEVWIVSSPSTLKLFIEFYFFLKSEFEIEVAVKF